MALSVEGPLRMVVLEGPIVDEADFEIMWLCSAEDWAVLQAGGTPGDECEWRLPWPIESLERAVASD